MIEKIKTYFKNFEKEAIPQVSVNCVIFGFKDKQLQLIVNRITLGTKTVTVLPGGYVNQKEDLTTAVHRIVEQSTGLKKILLKQFAVFGNANRSFEKEFKSLGEWAQDVDSPLIKWFSQRFMSICYLGLVDCSKIELMPTQFLEAAQWLSVDKVKILGMDHAQIAESARESLLKELPYSPIASNLLPAKFTLPELQALVEAILNREIDRPNFRRKILKTGMIKKVGKDSSNKRRPADLYTFKNGQNTSLIEDYKFGF